MFAILRILSLCFCMSVVMAMPVVLLLGDSLSTGYGVQATAVWSSTLKRRLETYHPPYRLINLSEPGLTTSLAKARWSDALKQYQPVATILALGANDALRGQSIAATEQRLRAMVNDAKSYGPVLLIGIRMPPNYGVTYSRNWQAMYARLGTMQGVMLMPALLKDVGEHWSLIQADGLHPNAQAQAIILSNVWEYLVQVLKKIT